LYLLSGFDLAEPHQAKRLVSEFFTGDKSCNPNTVAAARNDPGIRRVSRREITVRARETKPNGVDGCEETFQLPRRRREIPAGRTGLCAEPRPLQHDTSLTMLH
jgi:hypothetical protein